MNILAHLFLSNEIDDLMLGNFMGDFVKGRNYEKYPLKIQQGILLHRKIDEFTDNHDLHKVSRDRLRSKYGLHSGVVVDILYDHFLANEWGLYHSLPLEEYAVNVYQYLTKKLRSLPERLQQIVPIMTQNNWLVLYRSVGGIERVLAGMAKRTSLPNQVNYALEVLCKNYDEMKREFHIIFNDLINLVTYNINLYKFARK